MGILEALGGGVISAAGNLAGNWMNWQSQKETNQTSIDLANTAVQRRTEDLKAAGLNPVLAAGDPAASPAIAAPRVDTSIGSQAVQSAGQATNVAQTKAQTLLTLATAKEKNADATIKEALAKFADQLALSQAGKAVSGASIESSRATVSSTEAMIAQVIKNNPEFFQKLYKAEAEARVKKGIADADVSQQESEWYKALKGTGVFGQAVGSFAKILGMFK